MAMELTEPATEPATKPAVRALARSAVLESRDSAVS